MFGQAMRAGVIMPCVLQNAESVKMTLETIGQVRFTPHGQPDDIHFEWSFHLMANRWSPEVISLEKMNGVPAAKRKPAVLGELFIALGGEVSAGKPFAHEFQCEVERTVAGSWNEGFRRAMLFAPEVVIVVSNDARPDPGALDQLVRYGYDKTKSDVAIWSACQRQLSSGQPVETDGCDFSLFAFRPGTIRRHGFFDENFKPAYFEDNDYYARVVLGGRKARVLHQATYHHVGEGSQTIKLDPEMRHHVHHWWKSNEDYFVRKWGRKPVGTAAEVLAQYHRTPFNDPAKSLRDWELLPDRK